MQRNQNITLRQSVSSLKLSNRQKLHQRINHHVADAEDLSPSNSLAPQISISILGRRKQQISNLIGNHTVDLFRHGAVKGAEPGFDMSHAHSQLGADQSCSDS